MRSAVCRGQNLTELGAILNLTEPHVAGRRHTLIGYEGNSPPELLSLTN